MEVQVKAIINDLEKPQLDDLKQLRDSILSLATADDANLLQLSTELWNYSTRLSLDSPQDLRLLAVVRHCATLLALRSGGKDIAITMGLKSALAWGRAGEVEEGKRILTQIQEADCDLTGFSNDLLCCKSELSAQSGEIDESVQYITQITKPAIAADHCWNTAVTLYKQNNSQFAETFLEIGIKQGENHLPPEKISRMLRLLGTCYFEDNDKTSKCLGVAQQAVKVYSCPESHLLYIKFLATFGTESDLEMHLMEMYNVSESLLLEGLYIARDAGREISVHHILTAQSFTSLDILLLSIQLDLTTGDPTLLEQHLNSLQLNTGNTSDKHRITSKVLRLLWQAGVSRWEEDKYSEAETLYNHCLKFAADNDLAKLTRNISSCQIAQGKLSEAKEMLQSLEDDQQKTLLLCRIALQDGNHTEAEEYITKITDSDLLEVAALLTFKSNNQPLALRTLEQAIQTSANSQFVLTATRCLLRICNETEKQLMYFELALKNIPGPDEAAFFSLVAWNCGLEAKNQYKLMVQFFALCIRFIALLPNPTLENKQRQRSCYLLSIAASLQSVTCSMLLGDEIRLVLEQALELIDSCKKLGTEGLDNTTIHLMFLYELETCVRLDLPGLESLVKFIYDLPDITPQFIVRVAHVCSLSNKTGALVQNTLMTALQRHMACEVKDWTAVSRLYIELAKHPSTNFTMLFKEWMKNAEKYPETEAAWIVCQAWNRGIVLHSEHSIETGNILCNDAISACNFLPTYKQSYLKHMEKFKNEGMEM